MEKREIRRTKRQLSPAEKARLKQHQEQIAAEVPELIARDQMRKEACEEATLSGELRRAVHASQRSLTVIAERVGISPQLLDDFLTGERTLRSDILDRLAAVLGYELSQTS